MMTADRRERAPGFTLVELMMVMSIMGGVLGVCLMYVTSMGDAVTTELAHSDAAVRATDKLEMILSSLVDCRVVSPSPAAGPVASSYVQLKQPADVNGDGEVFFTDADGDYHVEYGVDGPGHVGRQNGYLEYRFVPHPNANKVTLDESTLGDINGDGLDDDVFVRGAIVRKWVGTDTGDEHPPASRGPQYLLWNVVQVETGAGYGGDVDGDLSDDPVFTMDQDSDVLTISVWVYGRDGKDRPVLHNAWTRTRLRNQ